jgi:hypothetical protein
MKRHLFESWRLLLYLEFVMLFHDFKKLREIVCDQTVRPLAPQTRVPSAELCHAVDLGCVFYFKQVLCLQRSAATTLLLRRYGWNAQMVIGARVLPFKSHAWVEIDGTLVNDKPNTLSTYQVLERC